LTSSEVASRAVSPASRFLPAPRNLAFDDGVQYERAFSLFGKVRVNHKVARFRQVNMTDPHAHHDALEFPDGQIVKVTRLIAGQTATVLQLPASTLDHKTVPQKAAARTIGV
jgi:hypothetical protein